jgi:segregation and condensation protein B
MISKPCYSAALRRPMTNRLKSVRLPMIYRILVTAKSDESSDPLVRDQVLAKVEAVLMMADVPISSRKIAEVTGLGDGHAARRQIDRLRAMYDSEQSPFTIADVAGGFRLMTRTVYHSWLLRLRRTGHDLRLSSAAMETLAVIAYKQPVMRAEIEAIRGVSCNELIHVLMEKGMVRIAGRHDSLGRPQLYGTTKSFLQSFGFNTLSDLPVVGSLTGTITPLGDQG